MKGIKFLVLGICCILQLQLASAQSAEVQQLLLNVEKLAQLKQTLQDMKNGYQTLSQGYDKVKDISKGNFDLHEVFLDGLLKVNPELRKYRRVGDIISYQIRLVKEYKAAFNHFKSSGNFAPAELDYMSKVYKGLFDRSIQNLNELTMVLTATKLRMSDDERLEAIDRLYLEMQEKWSFLTGFNSQNASLDKKRSELKLEAKNLRAIYGQ